MKGDGDMEWCIPFGDVVCNSGRNIRNQDRRGWEKRDYLCTIK